LASELATTELRAGRLRHAKRYIQTALVDPTENALAQAEWVSAHGVSVPDPHFDRVLWSFEAEALDALQRGEYDDAVRAGQSWQQDQPFAGDAAMFTSYVASVGAEDWELAATAAARGLVASPNDLMLRNNLVFSLANAGDVEGALRELRKIPRHVENVRQRATINATKGLVAFRSGAYAQGRLLYTHAADTFRFIGEADRERLARTLLVREEMLAGTRPVDELLQKVRAMSHGGTDGEFALWLARMEQIARLDLDLGVHRPAADAPQWVDLRDGRLFEADS
jgi:hypothetical protein